MLSVSKDATDELVAETAVGLLMSPADGAHQPPSCSHQPPSSGVAIILEGSILMADIETLPQAFYILFGLVYALHLDYPRYMRNTFNFVQHVLLNIGKEKLNAKVQTLKNQLTM